MRDQRSDVRELGRLGFQKFAARRSIEEEIAYGDRRSEWQPSFFDTKDLSSGDLNHGPARFFGSMRLQPQARD